MRTGGLCRLTPPNPHSVWILRLPGSVGQVELWFFRSSSNALSTQSVRESRAQLPRSALRPPCAQLSYVQSSGMSLAGVGEMGSEGDSAGLLLGPLSPCCSGLPAACCSGTKASQDATDPSGSRRRGTCRVHRGGARGARVPCVTLAGGSDWAAEEENK